MNDAQMAAHITVRNLVVSELRSETKGSRPAATYVQRWALYSNRSANV